MFQLFKLLYVSIAPLSENRCSLVDLLINDFLFKFDNFFTEISVFVLKVKVSPPSWSGWGASAPGKVTNFMELRYLLWKWSNFSLLMMLWTVIGDLSFSFFSQLLTCFIVFQFDSDFDLLWPYYVCKNYCLSLYFVTLLAPSSGVFTFNWFWPNSIYRQFEGAESRRSWEDRVGIRKLAWLF